LKICCKNCRFSQSSDFEFEHSLCRCANQNASHFLHVLDINHVCNQGMMPVPGIIPRALSAVEMREVYEYETGQAGREKK
jgi:hypothetical protein